VGVDFGKVKSYVAQAKSSGRRVAQQRAHRHARIRINSGSNTDSKGMKRPLLCVVVTLCAVNLVQAEETIRSLQQTLKDQGFYYGPVTGEKSAEMTAAVRRYQIRSGLQITGELNEETLRSVNSSSSSVAGGSKTNSKPAVSQPDTGRPDVNARMSQRSPPPSFSQPDRPMQANPSYSASFYQSAPIRVNRRIIAGSEHQLMSRGYYRGRVDGNYGRQMAFALRAFQSSAGLPPTGRLDMQTLDELGSSDADFAPRTCETWMVVRKFKHGKWKEKWKRYHRPLGNEEGDEDRQANSGPNWNPYNED
jgi:peptidoglycan hydrolase-like protein with peptidoglycan-binding domain